MKAYESSNNILPVKAAVYARFSSENQRNESIDGQIRAIRSYAKKNNIEIVKVYTDRAKSATTDKRPEFQKMIADSELGLFTIVLVHKLDRFSRNRVDSALYKQKLAKNGAKVVSVTEYFGDDAESVLMESVIEGFAEYYSKNLAREVMKGMKETALQCKHTGGIPPLGYDVAEDKTYIINEKEAIIVRTIYDMYVNGHSYKDIATHLREKGYKTKKGRDFVKNSLHSILCNEKYSGVYVFNKSASKDTFGKRNNHRQKSEEEIIKIDGGMPAIVSKEVFESARKMMAKRKRAPSANKAKELYLLQGLIECGECGSRYEGNRRKPKTKPLYVSYRCGARHRNIKCSNKEIKREYIEEFVLSELEKHLLSDEAIDNLVVKVNEYLEGKVETDKVELKQLRTDLDKVNESINNIVKAITNGFYQDEFKVKMEELKERKYKLETHILELEKTSTSPVVTKDKLKEMFSKFRYFVKERNLPECKKLIHEYVDKVVVFRDHIEVIFNVASLLFGH